jgi:RsiW-degrading membrane proteinase PrsW (M82 family)
VLAILVSLLPVSVFLLTLVVFDSFKLVSRSMLLRALVGGAAAALLAMPLHEWLFAVTDLGPRPFTRYVAPVTEEVLKTLVLVYPLVRRQIGFLVDAAIIGFAVGTGFALVENLQYVSALGERRIWVWIARGFGTAVLHATAAATVAISAKSLIDQHPERPVVAFLPGLGAAIALHSLFNHVLVSPILASLLLMVVVPLVVQVVYSRSERKTREWVGEGMDLDVQLLDLVKSQAFVGTRLGRYLRELRDRLPGPVVADMFCLLQLDLELAIRAKGMLMAREAGLEVPPDESLRDRLTERAYLEKTIGPTGLAALRPLQVTSDRDQWHQYLLGEAGGRLSWWRRAVDRLGALRRAS